MPSEARRAGRFYLIHKAEETSNKCFNEAEREYFYNSSEQRKESALAKGEKACSWSGWQISGSTALLRASSKPVLTPPTGCH